MFVPAVITASLVSLDAFFVGMSLRLKKDFNWLHLFVISSIILAMSVISYFAAGALIRHIDFETSWIIGGVFALLGFRDLFAKDEETMALAIGTIIVFGFIMSIDSMVGTIAVTVAHGKTLLSPVLMAGGHFLFLLIGSIAANFIKTSHKVHNILSASCLFLVAALNFTGVI